MLQAIEATIDKDGRVQLQQDIQLPEPRRALVIILDEPAYIISENALLSESALAEDWNRPEEDLAWARLQEDK
jgi:hypothetical protein